MPTAKKNGTKKKTSTKKKVIKPISNVGGGQGGILSSFGQATGQAR